MQTPVGSGVLRPVPRPLLVRAEVGRLVHVLYKDRAHEEQLRCHLHGRRAFADINFVVDLCVCVCVCVCVYVCDSVCVCVCV